jgi:hypothetical protein
MHERFGSHCVSEPACNSSDVRYDDLPKLLAAMRGQTSRDCHNRNQNLAISISGTATVFSTIVAVRHQRGDEPCFRLDSFFLLATRVPGKRQKGY